LNGLFSLDTLRSASGIARNAVKSIGLHATSLAGAANSPSFADVLGLKASSKPDPSNPAPSNPAISVPEIRENLAFAIESVLTRMGIPLDPALSFVAGEDGTAHLEGDHDRGAEIEANLQDDPVVRELVGQLLGSAAGADRRIVLHTIPVP